MRSGPQLPVLVNQAQHNNGGTWLNALACTQCLPSSRLSLSMSTECSPPAAVALGASLQSAGILRRSPVHMEPCQKIACIYPAKFTRDFLRCNALVFSVATGRLVQSSIHTRPSQSSRFRLGQYWACLLIVVHVEQANHSVGILWLNRQPNSSAETGLSMLLM